MPSWDLPSDTQAPHGKKSATRQEIALLDPFDLNGLLCLYSSIGM